MGNANVCAGWYPDPGMADQMRWWDGTKWTSSIDRPSTIGGQGSAVYPHPPRAPRPGPRLIRSPTDAEVVAGEWMRWFGFTDARVTQASRDGGIDVDSSQAVAQVKAYMTPIGRPALQQLHGVAASLGRRAIFFSLMAYTGDAVTWGDSVGMSLFRFNHAGEVDPVNGCAQQLMDGGGVPHPALPFPPTQTPGGSPTATQSPERLAFLPCYQGAYFAQAAAGARQGIVSKESLLWVVATWLPLVAIRVDYAIVERRREVHRSGMCLFEAIQGSLIVPASTATVGNVVESTPHLRASASGSEIVKLMQQALAARARVKTPQAQQRHEARIRELGLPTIATGISLTQVPGPLVPIAIGVYRSKAGDRALVWDRSSGRASNLLSRIVTLNLATLGPAAAGLGERLA